MHHGMGGKHGGYGYFDPHAESKWSSTDGSHNESGYSSAWSHSSGTS